MTKRKCVICGNLFTPLHPRGSKTAISCSAECSRENSLLKKRQTWQHVKDHVNKIRRDRRNNPQPRVSTNCFICGNEFIQHDHNHRACSPKCSRKLYNKGSVARYAHKHPPKIKSCVICGNKFSLRKSRGKAHTCSAKCSKHMRREKERTRYQNNRHKVANLQRLRQKKLLLALELCQQLGLQ
jgi:hypothetical protein